MVPAVVARRAVDSGLAERLVEIYLLYWSVLQNQSFPGDRLFLLTDVSELADQVCLDESADRTALDCWVVDIPEMH